MNDAIVRAAQAANTLGLRLLAAQGGDGNAIVSAASLSIALAMLAEGAGGDAEAELTAILGLTGNARTQAYAAIGAALGAYHDGEFSLTTLPETPYFRVANNVVLNDGFGADRAFLASLMEHFGATVQYTDLGSAAGKAVLDEWVRENTAGLIDTSAVEPDPMLRLVLQNALLFAARWRSAFKGMDTVTEPFTRADGSTVGAEMMHGTKVVRHALADGYQVIQLPYTADFAAYAVLTPEAFDAEGVSAVIDSLPYEPDSVSISLPSFDLKSATDVGEYLQQIGVRAIFEDPESFRGISLEEDVVVGAIAQQARLIMDEDGTIGAAVTEIAMRAMSLRFSEIEFRADRPFLLLIRHEATGIDVFTAYIGDPTAE
ncbi:MAG: serpin family protein [Ruaniaceae bacterium]|nr:serpin family protein [Ruaniaceae bacterium]